MEQKTYAAPDMQAIREAKQHKDIAARTKEQINRLKQQLSQLQDQRNDHSNKHSYLMAGCYKDWAYQQWEHTGLAGLTVVHQGQTCAIEPHYHLESDSFYRLPDGSYTVDAVVVELHAGNLPEGYAARWTINPETYEIYRTLISQVSNRTSLPAGWSYPSRRTITNRLKGANIKIEDEYGFEINWSYEHKEYTNNGKIGADSLVSMLVYELCDTSDLRKVAWHRNRCSQLAERLETTGMIESWEYAPVTQEIRTGWTEAGEPVYETRLTGYRGVFTFKMAPRKN